MSLIFFVGLCCVYFGKLCSYFWCIGSMLLGSCISLVK